MAENKSVKTKILEAVAEAVKEAWVETLLALPSTTAGFPALEDSRLIKRVTTAIDESTGSITLLLPEYEKYIESGRRAGAKQPPIDAIVKWLRRKGVTGNVNKIAFAVARKIARDGIKPRPFTADAVKQSTEDAGIIIELAFGDYLDEVIRTLIK